MRKAPRPFYQLARRTHLRGWRVPRGYFGSITAWPWYATHRHRTQAPKRRFRRRHERRRP